MKIAIEALGIDRFGGGRTATLNLLLNLIAIDRKNEYLVILSHPELGLKTNGNNFRQLISPVKNRVLVRIWAQLFLPFRLWNFDIIHFTKNLGLFAMRPAVIITVYDLTTLLHPSLQPKFDVLYWRYIQKITLSHAERVIAISQETKKDICNQYKISSQQIDVIYPTISPHIKPASQEDIQRIRQQYSLSDNYILHVGRLDIKNNLLKLIATYAQLLQQFEENIQLVIVGELYAKAPETNIESVVSQFGLCNEVIMIGSAPDEDLPALYSGARLVALLSHHEGFGLVAVEAIACGTPLLAHRTGALPEVLEDAVLLVENLDPINLAPILLNILSNEILRHQLIKRGLKQAMLYQNRTDAEQTLEIYNKINKN